MTRHKAFIAGIAIALSICAIAYALTTDQILQAVYDSSNTALRINQVTP